MPWPGDPQSFHKGSLVGLKAIAREGHRFIRWNGGSVDGGTKNIAFARLENDATIKAIFEEGPPVLPEPFDGEPDNFAHTATGGTGGRVYMVKRYDDPLNPVIWNRKSWTPGTLRWALHQPSPKIIKFSRDDVVVLTAFIPLAYMQDTTIQGPVTILGGIAVVSASGGSGGNNVFQQLRMRGYQGEGYKPFEGYPSNAPACLASCDTDD